MTGDMTEFGTQERDSFVRGFKGSGLIDRHCAGKCLGKDLTIDAQESFLFDSFFAFGHLGEGYRFVERGEGRESKYLILLSIVHREIGQHPSIHQETSLIAIGSEDIWDADRSSDAVYKPPFVKDNLLTAIDICGYDAQRYGGATDIRNAKYF